jgi:phage replication-related protein YjqB (UPF0714/DUF867 family)
MDLMPPTPDPVVSRVFDRQDEPRTLTELLARPGVAEQCELRSAFGLMAIHGGGLEQMTDVIAAAAAELAGASYYAVVHPDDVDHHLSSLRYRPAESAALAAFVDHVDVAVSIHGYGREGSWTSILAGGGNRRLAAAVAAEMADRVPGYDVVTELSRIPVELRGLSAHNPVNLPRWGGVQLELPPRVRGLSPLSPPAGADGFSPPTRALIEALAAVARDWPPRASGHRSLRDS